MKRILPFALCLVLLLIISSCAQINNSFAEELRASKWHTTFDNSTEVTLEFFEDNQAEISIKGDLDITCKISGTCVVNESSFVISDTTMAKNISIDYKLLGSEVELTYAGKTIVLNKQN